jgi:HD-like signal output (HDOD) protein
MRPTADDIARLAPFAGADRSLLETIAAGASLDVVESGRPSADWFKGHQVFLRSGEVQLATVNGQHVFLSSVSPPARFALPALDQAGIRCVETTTFLRIPEDLLQQADSAAASGSVVPPHLASLRRVLEMKIASGEVALPTMPDLAVKLNSVLRSPDGRHNDQHVAKLIQVDPALASKVIHVVNSAAFGFSRKATTVQQAVTRMGREQVRNIAISFLLRHAFRTQLGGLRRRAQATWLRSCHVAAVSFTLARHLPTLDPDRAMLAGLIHLIGVLPVLGLANLQPALFANRGLLDDACKAFQKPIGRKVLQRWGFDDDMLDAVEQAGNWGRVGTALPDYADVVLLAQMHADMGRANIEPRPPLNQLPAFQKLELGKLTPNKSIQVLEDADAEIKQLRQLLSRSS